MSQLILSNLKHRDPEAVVLSATEKRLLECSEEAWHIYQQCENDHYVRVVGHCFIRYCPNCMESKKSRNLGRITDNYAKYFGRTCKHFILTVPYGRFSKKRKEELEDAKRKFFQILRRCGMRVRAIAVFDYGNPKSEDPMETNIHIHVALSARFLNYDMLRSAWVRATSNPFAVLRVAENKRKDGSRCTDISTRAVFRYFARRMSGDFGHGTETVGFVEIGMTTKQYDRLVRGSRVFTWNRDRCTECVKMRKLWREGKIRAAKRPTCISCKVCAKESQTCAICGEKLKSVAASYYGTFIFAPQDWDPPPDVFTAEENCIIRKRDDYDKFERLKEA